MRTPFVVVAALLAVGSSATSQSFVNFESGPVAPVRSSADGTRLFVADTVGGRLCVFDTSNAALPFLIHEIPVGIDPVSVTPRNRDEVWVCNLVSDTVSIVDVERRLVVDTLRVVDEPSDVCFAGGKAFVTAATRDQVHVFDAATRASLGVVDIFGKDPRALAVSPDGSKVYAVVQRSGNGTTVLPAEVAPPPPPPTGGAGPAPQQALIVRADDPAWASEIPYTLPDHDVAEIDVASQTVLRYFDAVGTTNNGLAVDPASGDLWVANIDARNLVRFEPNLRGHAIDSRLTRITTGASPTVTAFDLNAGLDYTTLPNASALATALAEPFGVAFDQSQGVVYVAAHGTDRIGVVDASTGAVVGRIEVGVTPGAAIDTRSKRGPRGLALHPTANVLYVLNRLTDTLAVVDTQTRALLDEQHIATVDAMPAWMREGRKFLYDSKLAGNGTMSCAACHIDGDVDGIAWDLGDPGGSLTLPPPQPPPFDIDIFPFHPMKGPMMTQTLRGIAGTGVLHWRGDRSDFQAFNGAFDLLLGGSELSTTDMNDYAAFANAIAYPPNPNQLLDRSLRNTPVGNNEAEGEAAYHANVGGSQLPGFLSCNTCHTLPTGTNGLLIANTAIQDSQQMKVAQLRNMYRKVGFRNQPGPQKSGFGFMHDGAVDTLETFLQLPPFQPWPVSEMDDIATFLMSLDTGTAPAVGYQFAVNQSNAGSASVVADAVLLTSRAEAGDLDLTAHGFIDGVATGMLYVPGAFHFLTDRVGVGPFTAGQLQAMALAGDAELAFTAVMPGTGVRIALDRDEDGTDDGAERAVDYGSATPGCDGEPLLAVNSEPFLGNQQFGYAMHDAQPLTFGVLALALGSSSIPVFGIEVLVDPLTASLATIASNGSGDAYHAFPIADDPGIIGAQVFAQAIWLDPCGSEFWASSAGVMFTVQP